MTDARENKLPKWAQELLRVERLKNALRFPEEAKPYPDFFFDKNGHDQIGALRHVQDCWVYTASIGGGLRRHFYRNCHLYPSDTCVGFGRRPDGPVFLCEEDARLSLRWMIAEKAAADLLDAETVETRP